MNVARFEVAAHAIVIRSKESSLKIFQDKLSALPWGIDGFLRWMSLPDERIGGRTPMQAIEDGEGYLAEALVDELEHLHFAVATLNQARERYGALPQLAEVWDALDRASESLPWVIGD